MWDKPQNQYEKQQDKSSIFSSRNIIIGGVALVVLLLAAGGFFFYKFQSANSLLSDPNKAAEKDAQDLTDRVGKLIDLPTGEKPTVATITDITKLAGQTFFAQAQNGDRVIIYPGQKVAILFRPSTGKIINYTRSVDIGQSAPVSPTPAVAGASTEASPTPLPTATIAPKPTKKPFIRPTLEPTTQQAETPSPTPAQ